LVGKLPHRIKINEENENTGELKSKWITIQYDHMPKYCKECCLQSHDEKECWNIHHELHNRDEQEGTMENNSKLEEKEGNQISIFIIIVSTNG